MASQKKTKFTFKVPEILLARKWQKDLNRLLAKKSRVSASGQILLSALAFLSLNTAELSSISIACLVGLVSINLVRLAFTFAPNHMGPRPWKILFSTLVLSSAVFWSALCCASIQQFGLSSVQTLHILTIMSGVAASAMMGLSPDRPLAWSFIGLSMGPLIAQMIWLGQSEHYVTLGILGSFTLFLFGQVQVQSRTLIELFSRREQDRALFDSSFEGIVIHSEGKILEANRSTERMFGLSRDELIGSDVMSFISTDEIPSVQAQMTLEKGDPYMCRAIRSDGSFFPAEAVGRFILYNGQRVRLACIRDVSDRLKHERMELEKIAREKEVAEIREKTALEASQMKSRFLANISHEIRTPMNAVIAISELLSNEKLSPNGQRYLRSLNESGELLLELINDVLDFSKIEAGRVELDSQVFSLVDFVESQTDLLAGRAKKKGIGLHCHLDSTLPSSVRGDRGHMSQILMNLVGNAIKFTTRGEVSVSCKPAGSPSGQELRVRFEIRDTGCGISEEQGARLFQPFVQGDSSTSRKYGGTGLGLSISKSYVQLMGGDIGFESDGFSYTLFWFEVPLIIEKPVAQAVSPSSPRRQITQCVIVRDHLSNWESMAATMRSWGLRVIEDPKSKDLETAHLIIASNKMAAALNPDFHSKTLFVGEVRGRRFVSAEPGSSELYDGIMELVAGAGRVSLEPPHRPSPATESEVAFTFHGANVLVAEDNSTNKVVIMALLKKFGINVVIASNGIEAIKEFNKGVFDMILMDLQMPEMDGIEATKQIRRLERATRTHVPVVALTANASFQDREFCLAAGMDDYLTKPVRWVQLAQVLSTYMPDKRAA